MGEGSVGRRRYIKSIALQILNSVAGSQEWIKISNDMIKSDEGVRWIWEMGSHP